MSTPRQSQRWRGESCAWSPKPTDTSGLVTTVSPETGALASRAMQRRVCVVGVGLSDGPKTPEMSATMLEAQSFRRALDDAGCEKRDIDGLASAGYGGMHEVMLAEYLGTHAAMDGIDERRRLELRVPHDARVPRHPERRRRHGRDRVRQQPAVGIGPHTRHGRRRRGRPGRHGDAAADGLRVPDRAHARRRVRDGGAAAHARLRHHARAARVDRGADTRARSPQSPRDVPRSDHRRRRARRRSSSPIRCTSSTAA